MKNGWKGIEANFVKFCTIWKFRVKIYERKYSLNFRRFQRAITLNVLTYRKINMQFTVFILGGFCTVLYISFQTSLQSNVWRLLASTRTELLFYIFLVDIFKYLFLWKLFPYITVIVCYLNMRFSLPNTSIF